MLNIKNYNNEMVNKGMKYIISANISCSTTFNFFIKSN